MQPKSLGSISPACLIRGIGNSLKNAVPVKSGVSQEDIWKKLSPSKLICAAWNSHLQYAPGRSTKLPSNIDEEAFLYW